jgi:hypothetical protein
MSPVEHRVGLVAETMLHPAVITALVVLVVNDHLLKGHGPDWLTGKASDFAGLVLLPVVAAVVIGWTAQRLGSLVGRDPRLSPRLMCSIILVSAIGFAAVKVSPTVAGLYSAAITHASRPLASLTPHDGNGSLIVRSDATDLIALSALVVPWVLLRRACSARRSR